MQVELVQLAGRDGDTAHNLAAALRAIAGCAAGTRLLVFPETYLTGFPTAENVAALAEPLDGPSLRAVRRAAAERGWPWPSALPRTTTACSTTPRC